MAVAFAKSTGPLSEPRKSGALLGASPLAASTVRQKGRGLGVAIRWGSRPPNLRLPEAGPTNRAGARLLNPPDANTR